MPLHSEAVISALSGDLEIATRAIGGIARRRWLRLIRKVGPTSLSLVMITHASWKRRKQLLAVELFDAVFVETLLNPNLLGSQLYQPTSKELLILCAYRVGNGGSVLKSSACNYTTRHAILQFAMAVADSRAGTGQDGFTGGPTRHGDSLSITGFALGAERTAEAFGQQRSGCGIVGCARHHSRAGSA